MTCIVGVTDGSTVWIGGDAAASNRMEIILLAEPKVFRNGALLIGGAGDPNILHQLKHGMKAPDDFDEGVDQLDAYMARQFRKAVRKTLRKAKIRPENDFFQMTDLAPDWMLRYGKRLGKRSSYEHYNMALLVGIGGRLYEVEPNLTFIPCAPFAAVGSGQYAAKGVLTSMSGSGADPIRQIVIALDAASRGTPFVRPPFTVLNTTTGERLRIDSVSPGGEYEAVIEATEDLEARRAEAEAERRQEEKAKQKRLKKDRRKYGRRASRRRW